LNGSEDRMSLTSMNDIDLSPLPGRSPWAVSP
jgi:hypothetical protein